MWCQEAKGDAKNVLHRSASNLPTGGDAAPIIRRPLSPPVSDRFLFAGACDDDWVDRCVADDARPLSEQPVLAYNAGIVNARPLYDELVSQIDQPVRVIEGASDRRAADRTGYVDRMADCDRAAVPDACNVVGWENPTATAASLASLVAKARLAGRLEEEA